MLHGDLESYKSLKKGVMYATPEKAKQDQKSMSLGSAQECVSVGVGRRVLSLSL